MFLGMAGLMLAGLVVERTKEQTLAGLTRIRFGRQQQIKDKRNKKEKGRKSYAKVHG